MQSPKCLQTATPPTGAPISSSTHLTCPSSATAAEALARMRLSNVVTVADVDEAVRLMKVSMQQSSIDPRTGQIDMVRARGDYDRRRMDSALGLQGGWCGGLAMG